MGIGVHPRLRIGDLDQAKHLNGLFACLFFAQPLVQTDRLADLIAHGKYRIQRGHGLLKDHGNLVAANFTHLLVAQFEKIMPAIANLAADDLSRRRRDQPHNRKRRDTLATTGLADESEGLPFRYVKTDTVNCPQFAFRCKKGSLKILHLNEISHDYFANVLNISRIQYTTDRITHSIEYQDYQYNPESRWARYFSAKTVVTNLT